MNQADHKEREHFFGAAKLIAGVTILSRVLGLVRDMAIIAMGATRATDAFWTAFSVPNLFRRLFGEGALSAGFIPVFTEVLEGKHGAARARLVLANAAGLLALILAALVLLGELILAGWLAVAPGTWDRTLLLQLLMIVLPFMFTICLLALGSAALNCKGHFAYPAFAPILLNICLIAAAYVTHRYLRGADGPGLFVLSAAVIVAGVLQLIGVVWLLKRTDLAVFPYIRPIVPEVRRIARLVLPMMVPLGVMQFSAFFDRIYAWFMTATPESPTLNLFGVSIARPLSEGVVTCLYAANRMYQFPLGILAISLATAIFPLLSRYASRGETDALVESTNRAIRLSLFAGIPAGVGLILLGRQAVELIFVHGDFTAGDASRAVAILQMYCLGMWAYFANHILLRAFFAQKDARTPLVVSCILALVNIVLVVTLIFTPLGSAAIGLATALTASANTLVLTWILHTRWGRLGLRRIIGSVAKTVIATSLMSAAVWAVLRYVGPVGQELNRRLASHWAGDAVVLVAAVAGGVVVFIAAAVVLRCRELGELAGTLKRNNQDDPGAPIDPAV